MSRSMSSVSWLFQSFEENYACFTRCFLLLLLRLRIIFRRVRVSCLIWKQPSSSDSFLLLTFTLARAHTHIYKQKAPSPYLTRPRRQQSRCLTSYFNTSFHGDQWTRRKEKKNASMMSNTCCREESYKNASNLSSRQSERTLTFSTLSDVSIRNWDWRVSNNRFWPEELLIRNIGSYSPLFFLIAQNESRIFLTCLSSMPWPMIFFSRHNWRNR